MSGEKTLCQRYCEDSIAGRPSALARAWQAAGYAGQARPGYAGQLGPRSHSQKKSVLQSSPHGRTGIFVTLVPPMSRVGRARFGRARTHWASHQTRLGRAIKRGWGEPSNEVGASHQTRLGRAIKRGWGEPSNEVGASHQTRLGEPLNHSGLHACFKAAPWRYGASSARARSAHLVPARHGACSAHLVPARHCTPSTVPARHRGDFPTSARSAPG